MLRIGEFAGLTGLIVKALRHYDEKGVLVPADVDDQPAAPLGPPLFPNLEVHRIS
ncbi:MerR family DNA-binding transcriptional regulator [Streptomyces sp. NPDC014622]|uniref:MerR family DNA-binding transcriptional regulator n=1 Tax=Streptomyces sp. NPDC014622 TaxID=3364874 RepID=UPI0037034056